MIKKYLFNWTAGGLISLFSISGSIAQESKENLKAYPEASEGMTRYVLHLKPRENEDLFRVELQIGKTLELDAVNRYFFSGQLAEETIEGWGFTRYVLKDLGALAGTRIGLEPNEPKVSRFITLGGEPQLLRFNSRLPVVVYVPEGAEVRYRIWRTKAETSAVEPG
jgi:ecotin